MLKFPEMLFYPPPNGILRGPGSLQSLLSSGRENYLIFGAAEKIAAPPEDLPYIQKHRQSFLNTQAANPGTLRANLYQTLLGSAETRKGAGGDNLDLAAAGIILDPKEKTNAWVHVNKTPAAENSSKEATQKFIEREEEVPTPKSDTERKLQEEISSVTQKLASSGGTIDDIQKAFLQLQKVCEDSFNKLSLTAGRDAQNLLAVCAGVPSSKALCISPENALGGLRFEGLAVPLKRFVKTATKKFEQATKSPQTWSQFRDDFAHINSLTESHNSLDENDRAHLAVLVFAKKLEYLPQLTTGALLVLAEQDTQADERNALHEIAKIQAELLTDFSEFRRAGDTKMMVAITSTFLRLNSCAHTALPQPSDPWPLESGGKQMIDTLQELVSQWLVTAHCDCNKPSGAERAKASSDNIMDWLTLNAGVEGLLEENPEVLFDAAKQKGLGFSKPQMESLMNKAAALQLKKWSSALAWSVNPSSIFKLSAEYEERTHKEVRALLDKGLAGVEATLLQDPNAEIDNDWEKQHGLIVQDSGQSQFQTKSAMPSENDMFNQSRLGRLSSKLFEKPYYRTKITLRHVIDKEGNDYSFDVKTHEVVLNYYMYGSSEKHTIVAEANLGNVQVKGYYINGIKQAQIPSELVMIEPRYPVPVTKETKSVQ